MRKSSADNFHRSYLKAIFDYVALYYEADSTTTRLAVDSIAQT